MMQSSADQSANRDAGFASELPFWDEVEELRREQEAQQERRRSSPRAIACFILRITVLATLSRSFRRAGSPCASLLGGLATGVRALT
jgi:hypothetical protein